MPYDQKSARNLNRLIHTHPAEFMALGEKLASLELHPDWVAFCEVIANLRRTCQEALEEAETKNLTYYQGMAAAFRLILESPRTVIATVSRMEEEEEQARKVRTAQVRRGPLIDTEATLSIE